jgi:hypothetical protein
MTFESRQVQQSADQVESDPVVVGQRICVRQSRQVRSVTLGRRNTKPEEPAPIQGSCRNKLLDRLRSERLQPLVPCADVV